MDTCRAQGACIICRAKKVKCDVARPRCTYCNVRHLDCQYPETQLLRRKSATKSRKSLQRRQPGPAFPQPRSGVVLPEAGQTAFNHQSPTLHPHTVDDLLPQVANEGVFFQPDASGANENGTGPSGHLAPIEPATVLAPADAYRNDISHYFVENLLHQPAIPSAQDSGFGSNNSHDPELGFIGPSSGLSVLATNIASLVSRSASSVDGCAFQEEMELCQESLSKLQYSVQNLAQHGELVSEQDWYPLPPENVASKYRDTYFNTCQHVFPVVRRGYFESALRENDGGTATDNVPCYMLHNAILAVGASTSQAASVSASDRSAKTEAMKYFGNALRLQGYIFQSRADLMTIQAVCVLSMFAQIRGHHGLAYRFVALASTLAKSEGLHLTTREQRILGGEEGYDRCRIFWIVYTFDKLHALHTGFSSNIDDAQISCPFPVPQENDCTDFPDDSMNMFLNWARYAHVVSGIQTRLYSTWAIHTEEKYLYSTREELCSKIQSWHENLPAAYQAQNISLRTSTLAPRVKPIRALLFRIAYCSALATIHKRFSTFMTTRTCTIEGRFDAHSSDQEYLKASRENILLVDQVDVGVDAPHWFLAYMLLSSTIPLFLNVVSNPLETSAREDIALMHMATGIFAQLEFTTSGDISFNGVVDIPRLAMAFVEKARKQNESVISMSSTNFGPDPSPYLSLDPFISIETFSATEELDTFRLAESWSVRDFTQI